MIPRVTQITDGRKLPAPELLARVDSMNQRCAVQLRDPTLSARALLTLGRELRRRTRRVGARLIVNDRLDLALLLGADGIHLGSCSLAAAEVRGALGPEALVTRSAHDEAELALALSEADAALVSPIFPGKGLPCGLAAIARARALAPPGFGVVALGGVTPHRAQGCFEAGADGVAAIRADLVALSS